MNHVDIVMDFFSTEAVSQRCNCTKNDVNAFRISSVNVTKSGQFGRIYGKNY